MEFVLSLSIWSKGWMENYVALVWQLLVDIYCACNKKVQKCNLGFGYFLMEFLFSLSVLLWRLQSQMVSL